MAYSMHPKNGNNWSAGSENKVSDPAVAGFLWWQLATSLV